MLIMFTPNAAIGKTYHVGDIVVGEANRIELTRARPGGKGVNVAVLVRVLGVRDILASGFAGGPAGQFIDSSLIELDIRTDFVRIAENSRACHSFIRPSPYMCTEVNEIGPIVSDNETSALHGKATQIVREGDICFISGSLPRGCPEYEYAIVVDICKRAGAFVVLDSSGRPLTKALRSAPDVLKPNIDELRFLYGDGLATNEDVMNAVRSISLRWGIPVVAATLGADGAVV